MIKENLNLVIRGEQSVSYFIKSMIEFAVFKFYASRDKRRNNDKR